VAARVLFPNGFTTADLVETYAQLAPVLLPHLQNRPLTLKRFPTTITGEAFWEKDAPSFTPKWVKRYAVPRKAGGEPIQYISVPDVKTLRWTASLGCIEIHGFLHKYPYITSPTLIAFDLDPGEGMNVIDCCEVAIRVRAWFQQFGLECLPKTSGSKGMQVYVPSNTPASYELTQALAKLVAETLEKDDPRFIISRMARAERTGKVFIDWSQNAEHKTTVSVYSVRAKRAEPFVSMPLTWEEVQTALESGRPDVLEFRPDAAIERVARLGDLFADVLSVKQHVPNALLRRLGVQSPPKPSAVRVPTGSKVMPALPRSSGQGGRKLFVVHRLRKAYRIGIERKDAFHVFEVPKIPTSTQASTRAHEVDGTGLEYLTLESSEAGIVWDLGTFEVMEGSLDTGHVAIYLSGRKLDGAWLLERTRQLWRLSNLSGALKRGIPKNSSALAGLTGLRGKSGTHAAA
jgi:bifunctional non-homologous end joining protein LigD